MIELRRKIIRAVIVSCIFISLITLHGVADLRQAHQAVFMVAMIGLFGLVFNNIWISLFIGWTAFLYSFFKFSTGNIYITNILFGSILYLLTIMGFKKENINLFINAFLWFVFANVIYMVVQLAGYDFVYKKIVYHWFKEFVPNTNPHGFMADDSILGGLLAMAIPVLASRRSRLAMIGSVGLFIPLYLTETSLCFLAGIAGFLFVLFYKIRRKLWIALLVILIFLGGFYINKVDTLGTERFPLWRRILQDCMMHPITGWGLDSFRNTTPQKDFKYTNYTTHKDNILYKDGKRYNITKVEYWDNPHNLLLSLFFEFGFFGLVIFTGFMRRNVLLFKNNPKTSNTVGIAGFILAFLLVSMGHFPIFLARCACYIVPFFALYEVQTR